jgi:pimeloyl-ACP methyl ester carboxylesterase
MTRSLLRRSRLVAALLGIGLLASACGGAEDIARADDRTTPTSPDTSTQPPPTPSDPTGPGELPDGFGEGPQGQGMRRFLDQTLDWTDCGNGNECATVSVPLDYDRPNGQAISIAVKRDPADDQANRIGSLFINPGGPGGSGVDYVDFVGFDDVVANVYDVVGFDPRGVGRSTPVDCVSDADLDAYIASDPTPDDAAEVEEMEDIWTDFSEGCVERSGPLVEHMSTVEVARDIDLMRQLLGDDSLYYFGASYGTYIGATYAGLFPQNVGRLVLDGAVNPLEERRQTHIDQAAGFEKALTAYLEYCVGEGDCPLGDDVEGARQRLIDLLAEIDTDPLPTSTDREVTEGLAFLGVVYPLYSRDLWSYETASLAEAVDGSGDTMLLLADLYSQRKADGTYQSNSSEAQPAVNCLDHPEDESLAEIEAGGEDFIEASPVFGPAAQWWSYGCSNWPVSSTEEVPDFSVPGAAPIVVVGTTRDPATPYESAVELAEILDSGVLLTRDGDGHTAYGMGNQCINDAINSYLVEGTPPTDGTTC